jgi:large subunit ribosomal protein L20
MSRVKSGVTARRRHKKIIKQAKGFRGKRKNVFKLAKNAVMKAGMNAYRDRRLKKRTFHQLWILRINAACREHDLKYSRFIYGLELAGVEINRKMLSELAIKEPDVFKEIVEKAKSALPPEGKAPELPKTKKATAPKTEKKEEKIEAKEEKIDKKAPKKVAKKEEKVEVKEEEPKEEAGTEKLEKKSDEE